MAIASFTLSEDGVIAFQNALSCILKFTDDVSLEARKDKLVLTALNLSKSTYMSFTFAVNRFFSRYTYEGSVQHPDRFFCVLYIRALLSVFRSRIGTDPSRDREKETTIERCDVVLEDGPGKKSRVVAKIVCRNGITATHALPFEPKPPIHAKFDKNEAVNHWAISSRTLRQLMEHFGPKIELLDINTEGENVVNFACFTEKQYVKTEDFLNKPLHTSIAVDMDEFDDIGIEGKAHIIINVRDFRAILQHAGITSGQLSACYSNPGRPMRLSYNGDGILCEFLLMTVGEKGNPKQKSQKGRVGKTSDARPALEASPARSASVANNNVGAPASAVVQRPQQPPSDSQARPPATQRHSHFEMRPPPIPPPTLRSESLFVPQEDDNQWEPVNPDDEDDEREYVRLEWDASNQPDPDPVPPRFSDHQPNVHDESHTQPLEGFPSGLEPTQRLSQVRKFGLFSG